MFHLLALIIILSMSPSFTHTNTAQVALAHDVLQHIPDVAAMTPKETGLSCALRAFNMHIPTLVSDHVDVATVRSAKIIQTPGVLPVVDRTATHTGSAALIFKLAEPVVDINILTNRQQAVQTLLQNKNVYNKLQTIYQKAAPHDHDYFMAFQERELNEEEKTEQEKNYKKLYFTWPLLNKLNETNFALEFNPRFHQLFFAGSAVTPFVMVSCILDQYRQLKPLIQASDYMADAEFHYPITDRQKLKDARETIYDYLEEHPEKTDLIYALDCTKREVLDKTSPHEIEMQAKHGASYPMLMIKLFAKLLFKFGSTYFPPAFMHGVQNLPSTIASLPKMYYQLITLQHYTSSKEYFIYKDVSPKAASVGAGIATAVPLLATFLYGYTLNKLYNQTKQLNDLIHEHQKFLVSIARLLKAMRAVAKTIKHNPALAKYMPEHMHILSLFDTRNPAISSDLQKLVQNLLSSTFDGSHYLYVQQGKVLATHHLFERIKHELLPYVYAFGEIETYLSTAQVLQESQQKFGATWCFASYQDTDEPVVSMTDYWHPILDQNIVVTNSIALGHPTQHRKNIVITGPNAGGKTTNITAVLVNLILGQTLGICAARQATFTPFTLFNSYLNVTDDITAGDSLFKAEVKRAKTLKDAIARCGAQAKQFAFTIVDEMFTGTSPDVAMKVAHQFAKYLGEQTHSICLITTHFKEMTYLERETSTFINFKVGDACIEHGNISYPFTLLPGISTQNIAENMLIAEGVL